MKVTIDEDEWYPVLIPSVILTRDHDVEIPDALYEEYNMVVQRFHEVQEKLEPYFEQQTKE